jgi:molecular chaperone DnaK (HSP70)
LAGKVAGEFGGEISKAARRRLQDACEAAKIALSTADATDISVPEIQEGRDLNRHLERGEFETICGDIFQACLDPLTELFTDSSVAKSDISKVLFVGGSTQVPRVRELVADFFGPDVELFDAASNDIDVVQGAAMQGALMKGNTSGVLEGIALRNSTPLSLGISLANGLNFIILPRGSALPTTIVQPATTFRDNQQNVGFDIVQGERPLAADNIKLGHVTVEGIERAKRGIPKLSVQMDLTEDGILIVTAKDLKTGASVTARVENRGNLRPEEIEKLLGEAEAEKDNDPHRKERAESKSELQFFIDRAETSIEVESRTRRVPFAELERCRIAIRDTQDWIAAHQVEEPETYRQKQATLRDALNKVIHVQ